MFIEDIPPHLLPEDSEWGYGLPESSGLYWIQLASRGIPWKSCEIQLALYETASISLQSVLSPSGSIPQDMELFILDIAGGQRADVFPKKRIKNYAVRYIKAMPTTQRRTDGKHPN